MTARIANIVIVAALGLLVSAAPAAAQPQPPDKAQASEAARKAAAKKLARAATRKYNLRKFREALDGYTRAYDTFPAAGLLFNIAQCYRGLGEHEPAIRSYEAYLREQPDAANRGLVDELIAEEEGLLRTQREAQAAETERQRAEAAARVRAVAAERRARQRDEERTRTAALPDTSSSSPLVVVSDPVERDRDGESVFKKWWFWTAVGVVAIAAGGGALYLESQRETVLPAGSLGTHDQRQ